SYAYNFHMEPCQKAIDCLTPQFLDSFNANCWTMSPPCQPYTQGGKRLDDCDPRTKALFHLMDLVGRVKVKPDYIFLENVPNFEKSNSRNRVIQALQTAGFGHISEWILSPLQFGIPNHRRRYYLVAVRNPSPETAAFLASVLNPPRAPTDQIIGCDGIQDGCSTREGTGAEADTDATSAEEQQQGGRSDEDEDGDGDGGDDGPGVSHNTVRTSWPFPLPDPPAPSTIQYYLDTHHNRSLNLEEGGANSQTEGLDADLDEYRIPGSVVRRRKFISEG
ncbi:tRNA (cytosine-5-)-methyltransferase, partial [Quaeritorhiza haematococci]